MWKDTVQLGKRTLELETGHVARQADGAVLLREGNTVILSTVVHDPDAVRADFLPLTVDYREFMSAAGRIPGSFFRREGRQGEREVLASRLCDRSLRPLFPKAYHHETQVISSVLSYDADSDAPVLGILGAAAALHLSAIPWNGPLGAVKVARVNGEHVAMPTPEELARSDLELSVSLSAEGVVMIEGGARQVPDQEMLQAVEFAQEALSPVLALVERMRGEVGQPKFELPEPPPPAPYAERLEALGREHLGPALAEAEKKSRRRALKAAKHSVLETLGAELDEAGTSQLAAQGEGALDALEGTLLREQVVQQGRRVDGRGPEDIREISIEVDWLPGTHGSALFTRGETQALVSLTLGSLQDRLMVESVDGVSHERFLLHYNFPPYSVGEVRPMRGPGRREVGHGALARRSLEPVLPAESDFPYTIRVLSEISESNGSSSMATVCGGCLAMMDGGVPIAAPVAGIAMGLVKEGDTYVVLSDILGDEDHLGDMDFKVAGTEQGVTGIQMDNKLGSLPAEVMARAFEQARQGRLHILGEMTRVLTGPGAELKDHAPSHTVVTIAPNRVRELIGPGGKVVQEIQRSTGTRLEIDESGTVRIYAPDKRSLHHARERVLETAGNLEVGAVYDGVVTGVKEYGAFVRVRGGHEGLVHISEWAGQNDGAAMDTLAKQGDEVRVKVLEPDKQGRLRLSRKQAG